MWNSTSLVHLCIVHFNNLKVPHSSVQTISHTYNTVGSSYSSKRRHVLWYKKCKSILEQQQRILLIHYRKQIFTISTVKYGSYLHNLKCCCTVHGTKIVLFGTPSQPWCKCSQHHVVVCFAAGGSYAFHKINTIMQK